MSVNTVRKYISDEVWQEHKQIWKAKRKQVAPDIKSKDRRMMLKAVRMYSNAFISFSEIREATGISKWRLGKYLFKSGIEKIRRKYRKHKYE